MSVNKGKSAVSNILLIHYRLSKWKYQRLRVKRPDFAVETFSASQISQMAVSVEFGYPQCYTRLVTMSVAEKKGDSVYL